MSASGDAAAIGLDYRPALVNREGIGRYVRELVHGIGELEPERPLSLFGSTLAPAQLDPADRRGWGPRTALVRRRFPARLLPAWLRLSGRGVDQLTGGPALYHHTSYSRLPVRRACEVATVHDCAYLDPRGFLDAEHAERMRRVAQELVHHAARVLVPSEHSRGEVIEHLGADPARVVVTPLGGDHVQRIPIDAACGERLRRAGPYLLTVSRIDPRKNHLGMLRTFEALVREGLAQRWVVAGPTGHGAQAFEAALANSPVRDRVQRLRDVPEDELAALYRNAELLLFATLTEGFGLPALEAMALGCPVLGAKRGALPEVCGDAARLVDADDWESIFEGARPLLADPEERARRSRLGLERARRFTWRATAAGTLAAYRDVLREAGRGE